MKNGYEIRGSITAIFINRKGEQIEAYISTPKLDKVLAVDSTFYAQRAGEGRPLYVVCYQRKGVYRKFTTLQKLVAEPASGMRLTHLDGNGLNCVDSNLLSIKPFAKVRDVIKAAITKKPIPKGVKGVTWHTPSKKWAATVFHNKKRYCLGYYREEDDAIDAVTKFRAENGIK